MDLPESLTYLLLVILGYALTRVIDLACDGLRSRFSGNPADPGSPPALSATARQRLMERQSAYLHFRRSVTEAVEAAVNQGHGHYGLLYQIRDDYGDLLRHSSIGVSHAADSLIRCVTLLVNLGPSDQRYAMFTRSLAHFDDECRKDEGLVVVATRPRRVEFSVLDDAPRPAAQPSDAPDPPSGSDSASVRART